MKLQALVKSTINKQWDPFKDTGEAFRLCRVRTETAEPVPTWARVCLFYFCLSEIRVNDPSGLEWLENVSQPSRQEKLPGFQAA